MSPLSGTWMPGMLVSKVCSAIKFFPKPGPNRPIPTGDARWVQ